MPVLFVEVDNHTEPAAVVAAKIDRYQRFFGRQVKSDHGRDVPLWSTLWDDSGRGGFPPVALVFTKDVGAQARMNRIKAVRDLSRACWQPRWENPRGWSPKDTEDDGWWDFAGTVPVIATHLDQLRTHGPHGPVWWRFGHSDWQPITEALTNTGTEDEYRAREEQRSVERDAQEERHAAGARGGAFPPGGGQVAMPVLRWPRLPRRCLGRTGGHRQPVHGLPHAYGQPAALPRLNGRSRLRRPPRPTGSWPACAAGSRPASR